MFATDVDTGESRSTTQYLCVACKEGQMVGYTSISRKESSGQSEGMNMTNDFMTAVQSKRGSVRVVTGLSLYEWETPVDARGHRLGVVAAHVDQDVLHGLLDVGFEHEGRRGLHHGFEAGGSRRQDGQLERNS